jgi:hypothetical protein
MIEMLDKEFKSLVLNWALTFKCIQITDEWSKEVFPLKTWTSREIEIQGEKM